MDQQTSEEYARSLDRSDDLARLRDEFYRRDGEIYLDGNSLGPLSRRAEGSLLDALSDWKNHAVGGWTAGRTPGFTSLNVSGR